MTGSDGKTYTRNADGKWVNPEGKVLEDHAADLLGLQVGQGSNPTGWVMTDSGGRRIASSNRDTQMIIDAEIAAREDAAIVDRKLTPRRAQLEQTSDAVTKAGITGLGQRTTLNTAANQWDAGIGGFVAGSNAAANAAASGLNTTFAAEQDLLNQADWGIYGDYLNKTKDLYGMVQGQGYTPMQNDAYGVGLQNNAIGNFSNIYGGGLDYTSQGAQAYADPRAVQEQWNVYGDLRGAGQGNLDVTSQGAQAYADPESVAAQKDVMGRYKALSDPSVTAQERFLMETARRKAEQEQKGLRGAVARDQQLRGVRSGGAEIVDALGGGQQISEDRVLADLGMQANAVARAERMLAGYGGTASDIRKQSFSEAFGRGTAADTVAMSNAEKRLQAMGYSAEQITAMRDASFNEAYKRGTAADDASANNQRVRSQAATDYGSMATDIRTANDLTSRFNTEQSGITQRHIEDLASKERARVGELAKGSAEFGQKTTETMGARSASKFDAGTKTIDTNTARDMTTADVWKQIGDDAVAREDARIKAEEAISRDAFGRQTNLADFDLGVTGLQIGTNQTGFQNTLKAKTIAAGNEFSTQAAAQLAEDDGGILKKLTFGIL